MQPPALEEPPSPWDTEPGRTASAALPCNVPLTLYQVDRTLTLRFGSKYEPVDQRHVVLAVSAVGKGETVLIPMVPKDNFGVTGTAPEGATGVTLHAICLGKSGTLSLILPGTKNLQK